MGSRILTIDTATSACSVALFEDGKLIASDYEEVGRGHAEKLVPMIAQLPNKGHANQIVVNCGPGSFTGVRIGLSAAKALAMAWQVEICGYQSLHLVAAQALNEMEHPSPVFVAMIGGHGEFFVQNFDKHGNPMDDLLSLAPEAALLNTNANRFAGSAAQSLSALTSGVTDHSILPNAAKFNLLPKTYGYLPPTPVYGRAPDAQPAHQA